MDLRKKHKGKNPCVACSGWGYVTITWSDVEKKAKTKTCRACKGTGRRQKSPDKPGKIGGKNAKG